MPILRFPSFASVNLFWFAAVAASLRRGALVVPTPARRQPPSRCFGVPGSAVATTSRSRNGKGVRPRGERLSNSLRCSPRRAPLHSAALRFVRDNLRRRFAHFELGAHFLDLGR